MKPAPITFDDITILITHFNRSASLERLLKVLDDQDIKVGEVIVSDGGSKQEHLDQVYQLKNRFNFTLLTTKVNLGLGNSINVGHDAAKTPYILYIQEDFVPKQKFKTALADGLAIMQEEPVWDIVRFYSFPWAKFPYSKPYKKGFSIMKFSLWPWYMNHHKFFVYSDHPHLKRKSFDQKFGRYLEILDSDRTENTMCRSFLKNNGKGLYYEEYKDLFEHINSEHEPGLFREHKVKTKKFSDIAPLYWAYLKFKTLKETVYYILDK